MQKKIFMLILTMLFSLGFSTEKKCNTPSEEDHKCDCMIEDNFPCICRYNCAARVNNNCGWAFYLSGSFIYWQAKEGLDFNRTAYQDSVTPFHKVTDNLWKFNFHPGVKIAVGGYSKHDDWDLIVRYTRLKVEEKRSIELDVSNVNNFITYTLETFWLNGGVGALKPNNFNGIGVSKEHAIWRLNNNWIDTDFGRSFFVGTKLTFKPFFGLRGGFIDQKYHSSLTLYDTTNLSLTAVGHGDFGTGSWFVGPRIGFDTNWLTRSGFRIFGDTAFGLYYQQFSFHGKIYPIYDSNSVNPGIERVSLSSHESQITPNLDCSLGLGWGSYFHDRRWHFDLCLGYDFVFFWDQNVLEKASAVVQLYQPLRLPGNLMLQGLTVTAVIDF